MITSHLWSVIEMDGLVTIEHKWALIRCYRNELLTRCDWTQIADAALTLEEKEMWSIYRQALRDIPENYATPDEVIFPTPPEGEQ